MQNRPAPNALVYSTDGGGRMCPLCRSAANACQCQVVSAPVPAAGKTRVALENKGRGGKTVTVVRGLPLAPDALAVLGKALRTACGCGGTVKDGAVELQGDQQEPATAWLRKQGHLPPAARPGA